jgi:hypothetical protein
MSHRRWIGRLFGSAKASQQGSLALHGMSVLGVVSQSLSVATESHFVPPHPNKCVAHAHKNGASVRVRNREGASILD